jgi:ribose transport system ATP-binding protein
VRDAVVNAGSERGDQARSGDKVLEVKDVSKTFLGQKALSEVSFSVSRGEVHALVGHNGSGKSTLIKVLAGYHQPDDGSAMVAVDGEELSFGNPSSSHSLGLRFIHQDLGLVDQLTVLENLHLGRPFKTGIGGRIDRRSEKREAQAVLERIGLAADLDATVSLLSPIQRTQLGVARALSDQDDARILILDEPTAVLPSSEVDALFELLRKAAAEGVGIVYVSHRLEELDVIADQITVLRNGKVAGAGAADDFSQERLVKLIVGEDHVTTKELGQRSGHKTGAPRLVFEKVHAGELTGASFEVYGEEVVGIAGLAGSGIENIAPLIQRRIPLRSGRVAVGGEGLSDASPHELARHGIAVLATDRWLKGLGSLTVRENLTLPSLGEFWRRGRLRGKQERKATNEGIRSFNIKPANPEAKLEELSGGNQQKVNLAKWLRTSPQLLVLSEPTQGVDVGGKEDILQVVRGAASKGTGVVVCSSDVYELESVCDRIVVLRGGREASELSGPDLNAKRISEECYGAEVSK